MKETYASLIKLSRLSTITRGSALSLNEARIAVDEVVKRIAELDQLLAKEATAGRDLSETVYTSGLWWILGFTIAGVVLGGVVLIVTRPITRPVFKSALWGERWPRATCGSGSSTAAGRSRPALRRDQCPG
jgi:hypothetical protein